MKKKVEIVDFGFEAYASRFYLREVFYWYDGPVLFTCTYQHPERGQICLLGLAIDMDSSHGYEYLFVTMSKSRMRNVENNVTSVRQAMKFPDGPKFSRQLLGSIWASSSYFLVKGFEDDFDKWCMIVKDDVIAKDWLFLGGFKWQDYRASKKPDISGRNAKSRKAIRRLAKRNLAKAALYPHQQAALEQIAEMAYDTWEVSSQTGNV